MTRTGIAAGLSAFLLVALSAGPVSAGQDEPGRSKPVVTRLTPASGGTAPAHTEPVPMTDVDPVYPEAGMDGVICTAPGRCIGTGGYNMLGHRTRGPVAALTEGDVSSTPVRTPFQAGESFVHEGSADSATSAVVVGQYVDDQGRYRGLLVTGVPIEP